LHKAKEMLGAFKKNPYLCEEAEHWGSKHKTHSRTLHSAVGALEFEVGQKINDLIKTGEDMIKLVRNPLQKFQQSLAALATF
jgi:hypothetical protein